MLWSRIFRAVTLTMDRPGASQAYAENPTASSSFRIDSVTQPNPPPAGVEAIYAEVRRLTGAREGTDPPEVTAVAPGIVGVAVRTPTLPPAAHTSCWLVGDGDLLAIDPGSPYPDQQDALAAEIAARGRLA